MAAINVTRLQLITPFVHAPFAFFHAVPAEAAEADEGQNKDRKETERERKGEPFSDGDGD
jgi:hypothetical protein